MIRSRDSKESGRALLMGKRVTFFCANYIYTGVLVGLDEKCVEIESFGEKNVG